MWNNIVQEDNQDNENIDKPQIVEEVKQTSVEQIVEVVNQSFSMFRAMLFADEYYRTKKPEVEGND